MTLVWKGIRISKWLLESQVLAQQMDMSIMSLKCFSLDKKQKPVEPTEVQSNKPNFYPKWDQKTLRLMSLCVIPNSYLGRHFLKLNEPSPSTNKRCSEKALSHSAMALKSLALAGMLKLWFPCVELRPSQHEATFWLHVQLEAKSKGLTMSAKTLGQWRNCCMYIACLIQNLPPQLTSHSFCLQNPSIQMDCGYDSRDQGKEGKNTHNSQSLLCLLLYTSDIAN